MSNVGTPRLGCDEMIFKTICYISPNRIANREDPDQTASSEAVSYGSALFI